jgi:hypothetical protein
MKVILKGKERLRNVVSVNPRLGSPIGNVKRSRNRWNLAKIKNRSIFISRDGLNATNNSSSSATVYYNYRSVSAKKGFHISADFPGPVLFYFEVTLMSTQYKG